MEEIFEKLLETKDVRIIKIISPQNFQSEEFCQDDDEFVYLLCGSAKLQIEEKIIELNAGDFTFIKAGQKHKVLDTSNSQITKWLAVHISNNSY